MKKSIEKNVKILDGIVCIGNLHKKESLNEGKFGKSYFRKIFRKKTFLFLGLVLLLILIGLVGFKFRHKIKIPSVIKWKNFSVTFSDSVTEKKEVKSIENQAPEEEVNQPEEPVKTEAEIEREQQAEAKTWLEENAQNKTILASAKKEMGDDNVLVQYEYQQQLADFEWLDQQTAYPDIMKKAKKEWGTDYEMVRDMYEEEVAKKGEQK